MSDDQEETKKSRVKKEQKVLPIPNDHVFPTHQVCHGCGARGLALADMISPDGLPVVDTLHMCDPCKQRNTEAWWRALGHTRPKENTW